VLCAHPHNVPTVPATRKTSAAVEKSMLPEKTNELKAHIIQYSSHIQHMLGKSIKGLINRDAGILREVIDNDEARANEIELTIDEMCTNLIAQFQPMAKELRTVLMIYNMNNSLERMGDHAVNISESALEVIKYPAIKPFIDIPRMSEIGTQMLEDAIQSFIDQDPLIARDVCRRDSIIDGLRDQVMRELITYMSGNPAIISYCLHVLRIAENLERIADLTTNICEDVIFIAQGRVVKHHLRNGESDTETK